MAHTRKRQLDDLFGKLMGFSPIVGVFGHRQVGKSTYLSQKIPHYMTLDDEDTLKLLRGGPSKFLGELAPLPVAIDECQIEPRLFPALKEWIRTHKKPGQFILSGSVRFTSRRAIRESLAGRITAIELLPLVLSELNETSLPDILPRLIANREFNEQTLSELPPQSELRQKQPTFDRYLDRGGLPGLCFVRSPRLRSELLNELHRLILDRDLRMIHETRLSLELMQRYLQEIASLAARDWSPYDATAIRRKLGLAPATQKALLHALESTYMIRRIPMQGRAGEFILFEDQLEENLLNFSKTPAPFKMLGAFYRNARAQFTYRLGDTIQVHSHWTRGGARVPLCISNQQGTLGFIPLATEQDKPSLSQSRSADSFLRQHPEAKVIYLRPDRSPPRVIDSRSLSCAVTALI